MPARPGITNALGCIVADLRHDFVRTINTPLDAMDIDRLAGMLAAQAGEGEALIRQEPVHIDAVEVAHSLDMQFAGQTHLLQVPLEAVEMTRGDIRRPSRRSISTGSASAFPKSGRRSSM